MTEVKLQSNYRTNVFRGIIGEEAEPEFRRTGVSIGNKKKEKVTRCSMFERCSK